MTVIVIATIVFFVLIVLALVIRDRQVSLVVLHDANQRLGTYRKIRHVLGIHMLALYPSLTASDLRMQLIKQLRIYEFISDDESERRWERIWMPKLMRTSENLATSDVAKQDTEFADIIDGFQTNERLIADAKSTRNSIVSRPTVAMWKNIPEIQDSHDVSDSAVIETSR